eukprot:1733231-Ditylum_brightwellii.AAC.1
MSEKNVDIAAKSVVLIGKVLGRVRRDVYDIALLCNIEDDQFMEMTVYNLQRYGITKSALLLSIQNNTHLCPDVISEESDGSRGGEGATYMEEDVLEDSELEETTKESEVESSNEEEDAAGNVARNGKAVKKGDLQSTDMEFYTWNCHTKKHVKWDYSIDVVRETPHNKQTRFPSMNNISVQEWRNLSAAGFF